MSDLNVALVNQAYHAFGRGDIGALLEAVDTAAVVGELRLVAERH